MKWSKVFDLIKEMGYHQLAQIFMTLDHGEKAKKIAKVALERPVVKCEYCKKECSGYTYLLTHLNKRKPMDCIIHYKRFDKLKELQERKKKEQDYAKAMKVVPDKEKCLQRAKDHFTYKCKTHLKIAVNCVKLSKHGAQVKNILSLW